MPQVPERSAVPYPRLLLTRYKYGKILERAIVHLTGFSLMSYEVSKLRRQPYSPVLSLTTVGEQTGLLRMVILPYVRRGNDLIVVGSLGGGPRDPRWVHNVRHDGRCWIRIHRSSHAAFARVLEGDERTQGLESVVAVRPFVVQYDERAASRGRVMPLVAIGLREHTVPVPAANDAAAPYGPVSLSTRS
jgi:deazaflavin-dependent oxidoreductase (nitroreductase family)